MKEQGHLKDLKSLENWIVPVKVFKNDYYEVRGYNLSSPCFDVGFNPVLFLCKFTEDWIPKLNYAPSQTTTLGFCTSKLMEWIPERCQWFIEYLKKTYLFLDAEFAWCDLFDHLATFEKKDPRQHVFGMTFYGPEMVEEIGRKKLLSAPVYKVEEFENGGILLQLAEQPFFPHQKKYLMEVQEYLGLGKASRKIQLAVGKNVIAQPSSMLLRKKIYPYWERDLFKESHEKDAIFRKIKNPRNRWGYGAAGIFSIPNQKASDEYFISFIRNRLFTLYRKEIKPIHLDRLERQFLSNNRLSGYSVSEPPFAGRFREPEIDLCKFTEPKMPKLNYDQESITTLGFCTDDLQEGSQERCQWFIDYLKENYRYLEPEFAWCDLFDRLAMFEKKDPRKHVFGMTFYGPEMVEEIGKEKLLSAPVYKVEELENGGILLQLAEQPFFPHPKKYLRGVEEYLGLGQPVQKRESLAVPDWLRPTKIGRVRIPKKTCFRVVAGAPAGELSVKEAGVSLFELFLTNVYEPKELEDPEEVVFASWFSKLQTKLKPFLGGSNYRDRFEAVVGLPVHDPLKLNFRILDLDEKKLTDSLARCRELFEGQGLEGEPKIHILG